MNISKAQQDLLDRYFQDQLSGMELTAFLKEVTQNPDLQKAMEIQTSIAEGVESYGNHTLKERLRQISEAHKEEKNNTKSSRIFFIRIASAAAIALIIISAYFLFFKNSNEKLFLAYYEPFKLSQFRSVNSSNNSIENTYNNKNYEAAIPLLQDELARRPDDSKLLLALGNALLNTNSNQQAITSFQKILDRKDPLYEDQARWYLALTFLRLEQHEKSKASLHPLIKNPNADFHQQAKALLQKIE